MTTDLMTEEDDLDPRVRDYFNQMMQRNQRRDTPEYRSSIAQDRMGDEDASISRAQLGGVAEGLSKLGTIGGKSPDVKPLTTTLTNLDLAQKERNKGMLADEDDAQKRGGMNAKVYEYLQSRTDKRNEAGLNRDALNARQKADLEAKAAQRASDQEFKLGLANIAAAARGGNDQRKKDKDYFANADALQRQYDNDPEVKKTKEVQSAAHVLNTLGSSTPSAQADQALIFNWMKLQDPGSVVRETEYASAEATRGLMDKAGAYFQKLNNGQLLTPEQRKKFVEEGKNLARGYAGRMRDINKQFEDRGARRGVDVQDLRFVVEANPADDVKQAPGVKQPPPGEDLPATAKDPGMAIAAPAAPKKVYKDGDTKTINGVTHIRQNGVWNPVTDGGNGGGGGGGSI